MPFASVALLLVSLLSPPAHAGENNSREMEKLLASSLHAIGNNKLDVALNEVDSLLKVNPNFKLAQLVRGDLLLARSQELDNFGNAPNAPRASMNDLRDEARARLLRVQQPQPFNSTPKYLWQLDDQQRYAVVIDTSKSTLYLYENINGKPRYVDDYYISVGKKGADKVSEGDQKTPLGVYFINSHLGKDKITEFYGPEAFPLSYPNEWDKREGRNGHGIWLHGTSNSTYSRPPKASNGCVVLANKDLLQLGKLIQIGHAPVIITSHMEWSKDSDKADRKQLIDEIEKWRSDWSSLNTNAYLEHYAQDFSSAKKNRIAFAKHKKLVNSRKTWIKVKLHKLSIFSYPNQPDLAVVSFEQDYDSNNLTNQMIKRQYWMKRNNVWQIVYEGSA